MKRLRLKFGPLTRAALLVLLLAAQGMASAHELGHIGGGDSAPCATCSIGNGLNAAVAVCHQAPVIIEHYALIPVEPFQRVFSSLFAVHFPRAPPTSL